MAWSKAADAREARSYAQGHVQLTRSAPATDTQPDHMRFKQACSCRLLVLLGANWEDTSEVPAMRCMLYSDQHSCSLQSVL